MPPTDADETVIASVLSVPSPHAFEGVTVSVPEVADEKSAVMAWVPCPLAIVKPVPE